MKKCIIEWNLIFFVGRWLATADLSAIENYNDSLSTPQTIFTHDGRKNHLELLLCEHSYCRFNFMQNFYKVNFKFCELEGVSRGHLLCEFKPSA